LSNVAIFLRDCERQDLSSVQEIEDSSFDDPYSPSLFSSFMNKEMIFRVATVGESLAGYSVVALQGAPKALVVSLAVRSEFRRRGVATALIADVVNILKSRFPRVKSIELQVGARNLVAISLYSKLGFEKNRTIENYYGWGKDGILMSLEL
jgi:[ribosomal protein S18]-alanine N-acetyltransferase